MATQLRHFKTIFITSSPAVSLETGWGSEPVGRHPRGLCRQPDDRVMGSLHPLALLEEGSVSCQAGRAVAPTQGPKHSWSLALGLCTQLCPGTFWMS